MKKINAGVLYYVVFILLIGWIICIAILSSLRLNQFLYNTVKVTDNLITDINSSINIISSNPGLVHYNDSLVLQLDSSRVTKVIVKKKYWGYYSILHICAIQNKTKLTDILLTGIDLTKKEPVALYMVDENKYLSICGKTILAGTCYLPHLGIRRGYIEGNTFKAKKMVKGITKVSKKVLPELDKKVTNSFLDILKEFRPDSSVTLHSINEFKAKNAHSNSFQLKTICYFSDKPIYIDNKIINGNIIICSSKIIRISKSNIIKDIILIAPKVLLMEGFVGNLQVIATDSLIVEKRCKIKYPSVLALLSENTSNMYFKIEEKCRIDGAILMQQYAKALSKPVLIIEKGTDIYGQVYCDGVIKAKGNIYGSLYCQSFLLNTRSSIYENHLLDNIIDRTKLSVYYSGVVIADSGEVVLKTIKRLD